MSAISVITKLPNTEQSSKGKGKTHKSTNRQNQSSWRPVLVMEEAGVPGQATGKLYHLRLRVERTLFVIYKAGGEPTPYW